MLEYMNGRRAYCPDLVAVMTDAFERASRHLANPPNEKVREKLALEIIRRIDEGERDPKLLSEMALMRGAGYNGHRRSD